MSFKLSEVIKKSKDQISKIRKDDLVELLYQNVEFEQFLNPKESLDLKIIRESIEEIKNNLIAHILEENKKLRFKVEAVEGINMSLVSKFIKLERDHWSLNQCDCKNNIEISGIPDIVSDKDLEGTVIGIIGKLDIKCSAEDSKNSKNNRKP